MRMMDLKRDFERDGYVVVEKFFAADLMLKLDQLIRDYFGNSPDYVHNKEFIEASKTDVIPWFPQNDGASAFDEIDADPRFNELSQLILGSGWTSQYCMVMFSRQGTNGQAWHQDCTPEIAGVFNLNRLVYTCDVTDEIGGQIAVVPGSHRRGVIPKGDPTGRFDGQVVLRPSQGTLLFLHGHTWHRVLPVKGPKRFSTNYRAAPAGTPDDVTDVCVYRNMRYQFSTSRVIQERLIGESPARQ